LPLQIFEPRYLELVRDCSRDDSGFGVCLLLPDTGEKNLQHHSRIGTLAHISDFYTLENGLLGITAQGSTRFQVLRTRFRDNGLMLAEVGWLEEPPETPMTEEFLLLAEITRRLMEEVGSQYADYSPSRLDDAAWVGYRLTELLPLDKLEKQVLLEFKDPLDRLGRLLEVIPQVSAPEDGE